MELSKTSCVTEPNLDTEILRDFDIALNQKLCSTSTSRRATIIKNGHPEGVLRKKCSENMQQVYRRTTMPKWIKNRFEHATRRFELVACGFELIARRFELVTRRFNLVTREFELVTRRLELVTRRFEIVTRRFDIVIRKVDFVIREFELVYLNSQLVDLNSHFWILCSCF